MPSAWSDKDERQYQHVFESEKERGSETDRAKEIAARAVNKQRRAEGRAKDPESRATGDPNSRLESRTKAELLNRAEELGIADRSAMSKLELIAAIRRH